MEIQGRAIVIHPGELMMIFQYYPVTVTKKKIHQKTKSAQCWIKHSKFHKFLVCPGESLNTSSNSGVHCFIGEVLRSLGYGSFYTLSDTKIKYVKWELTILET